MLNPARILTLSPEKETRIICISDIHGNLDLFVRLLEKVQFSDEDLLLLLGDLYTKGPKPHETLKYLIKLCERPNVHSLRGNCDWISDEIAASEAEWLRALPHIIETEDYIFVHGGLTSRDLCEQKDWPCMKNYGFMEQALSFDKYVVTGHWPVSNYCHEISCHAPIINEEKRIIAIDGGNVIRAGGQLNAFMIQNGEFSHESMDALPTIVAEKSQAPKGGTLNVTWNDRFVELLEEGEEFSVYKHIKTGRTMPIANATIWIDDDGNRCAYDTTDYYLPVETGDILSVVRCFSERIYAKKNEVEGWYML